MKSQIKQVASLSCIPAPSPDEAHRELAKWLNEEPNRPADKQCIAVLLVDRQLLIATINELYSKLDLLGE